MPVRDNERNDFIRDIIDEDLRAGRHTKVATRFPPEPNGYLHIGHAKSICLNFGIAQDYQGTCNLRYDDTNPEKEEVEYVQSIENDVRWLGFSPTAVLFSADYFPKMYELAERLVREGKAYVCDLNDEQIREYRGTLSEPGKPSPFRDRTVEDNLARLRKMKAGEFPDKACTLRAKIDMASPNMKMRDPLLYRIRHEEHHRSGNQWCIYPMYDWAHPIEDAIEGITHSICTLEFENNRELYDWVLDNTGPWNPRPHQYEFARLALEYTVMSKRKLLQLVKEKHVRGWDDPRMPTISGLRRRGYSPEAIRTFADMIGVAKANSMVDIGKLEYCVRDDLNKNAPRVLAVLRPIEVELVGLSEPVQIDAPYFPPDVGKPGSRPLSIGNTIFIDADDWRDDPPKDYQRLAPGRTVRLRHGPCITVEAGTKPTGNKLRATVVPDTFGKNPEGIKVSGVIHWVDAATSLPAEIRIYERLMKSAKPEEGGGDFLDNIDKSSLEVIPNARVEASLAKAAVGSRFQFERVGYFVIDPDSKPGALVLNRIISLRDTATSAKAASNPEATGSSATADGERKVNPKAQRRPKGKSPAEWRAEARARDAELQKMHDDIAALFGVTPEQADLLSGDRTTAKLALDVANATGFAEITAKWMVNELPRALGDQELEDVKLDADRFGELISALGEGKLPAPVAKQALSEMIATGKRLGELDVAAKGAEVVGVAELGTKAEALLAANPDKVAQIKAGKVGLLGFFVGQLVKASPGADPKTVNEVLRLRLGLPAN